jgi:hypothetical protein
LLYLVRNGYVTKETNNWNENTDYYEDTSFEEFKRMVQSANKET